MTKCLHKFQVDMPINIIVIVVQSLENLYTFTLRQPIFPYNIIENSSTSLAYNSDSVDPNNSKFGSEARCYDLIDHIKIRGKLMKICIIIFLMTLYENQQFYLKKIHEMTAIGSSPISYTRLK